MRRDRDGLDPAFVVAVVILVAVAVFLYLTASSAPEASADNGAEIGTALRAHVDPSECRYVRSDGRHGYTDREIRRTIRCAVRRWPVPGGPSFAIAVARCESGFEAEAYNAGGYGGVYQQSIRRWPRAR